MEISEFHTVKLRNGDMSGIELIRVYTKHDVTSSTPTVRQSHYYYNRSPSDGSQERERKGVKCTGNGNYHVPGAWYLRDSIWNVRQ